ncbi:RagB/SusD family nutrient uptake outer membrane protein [Chitinophaga horti]|uniref:RagB/SusD family nutrient uptake outer membrane protein n=1 Tax=Chitinophaga horti TaxID=2920382 RepID=A0ABY6J3H8_9BACT|nr:RagB/SusD family nutrient uptake outer membrane protein [Chitinophaga horti]UYQ94060.1 RagB/SusD family nutrient uptake outer membrane protein [Chitinophaga horti]
MKKNTLITILIGSALLLGAASCKKYFEPSTAKSEEEALNDADDVQSASIGTYAVLKNPTYVRSIHFLSEYPSDNIAQGQASSDALSNAYRYTHLVDMSHVYNVWQQSYFVINAANRVIAFVPDESTTALRQLKGENLYLRAMMYFNLCRVFGRPYTQGNGSNEAVPIVKEDTKEEFPGRATVQQVYDFVIADLEKAAELMTTQKNNNFASKEVAYALLSRVYLYKGDNPKAIEYADKVLTSGRYNLLQGSAYTSYFRGVPEDNKETIFCIRHIKTENRDFNAIGSMYYSEGGQGATGWGEIYASQQYVNFLDKNPADLRHAFITPYTTTGVVQYPYTVPVANVTLNTKLNPRTPMYYINKYNYQEGLTNLSSPVYLRLAEMYLNRAEANAKIGGAGLQMALDDVNTIRQRAGLSGAALHTLASVAAAGKTVLDVVLEERRLEFAFEGQRPYDLFRNNRPLVRDYPGTHALNNTPNTNVNQTIQPTDNRVIFFIPNRERLVNKNLTQNP